MKKIVTAVLSASLMLVNFTGIANAEEQINIESVKTNGAGFVISFDSKVLEDSISDNIIVKDENGEIISEASVDEQNPNAVNVSVPQEMIGKQCTLIIRNGVKGQESAELGEVYMSTLKLPGYFEEFGEDYTAGDWKWRNYTASGNAIIKDGMLRVIDSASYDVTKNEVIVYKNDYTDYSYDTSVLEYDYIHTTKSDEDWKNSFSTLLKLNSDTISVKSWAWNLENGYSINNYGLKDQLRYTKYNGITINNKNATSNLVKQQLTQGEKYRYRIETETFSDSVLITVKRALYTNGVLGEYSVIATKEDNESPDLSSGGVAFWSIREGVLYTLDNILYYGYEDVELTSINQIKEDIEEKISYYYELKDDGNDYSKELAEIDIQVEELLGLGLDIGEEYAEMLKELKAVRIISAEFGGDKITVVFNKVIDIDSAKENITVKNADGVDAVTEVSASSNGKEIILSCSKEIYGKECFMTIGADLLADTGAALGENYLSVFTPEGFYENFDTNYQGDWVYNSLGTVKTANTSDGILHLVNNSGTSNKNGEVVMNYKKNYSDYLYTDSVFEFDYITVEELTSAESWTNKWAAFVKVPADFVYVSNWVFAVRNGYGFVTKENTDNLSYTRYSDTEPDKSGNLKTVKANMNNPVAEPIRFRIETTTDAENEKVTLKVYTANYTDGVLGEYTSVGTVTSPGGGAKTDTEAFLGAGSCAFWSGRNGCHAVDNVLFANASQKIELLSSEEVVAEVESSLEALKETALTNDTKAEILKIGRMLEFLDSADYSVSDSILSSYESLEAQYPMIDSFDISDKVTHYESNIKFSTGIDKAYITKDYITVTVDAEVYDDYEIIADSADAVTDVVVKIFNNREYDSKINVILSADMATPGKLTIGEKKVCELSEKAEVLIESIEKNDNTVTALIKNKASAAAEYTVILTAWEKEAELDKLLAVKAFEGRLNSGETEEISLTVDENTEFEYTGYVLNSAKQLSYKPVGSAVLVTPDESDYEGIYLDTGAETLKTGGKLDSGKPGRYAYIIVFNEGYDFSKITENNAILYAGAVTTNEQGYYLINTKLNSGLLLKDNDANVLPGNIYTYTYTDENGLSDAAVKKYFAPLEVRENGVLAVNNAESAEKLAEILEEQKDILGLTSDLYDGVTKEGIAEIIYPKLSTLGITTENVQEILTEYALITAFNEGKTDLIYKDNKFIYEDIMTIKDIDSREGVTVKNIFDTLLTNEGKSAVVSEMLNNDFNDIEDVTKSFAENVILKTLHMSNKSGYGVVAEAITKNNADYIELDYGRYFSLSENSRSNIDKKLLGKDYEDKNALSNGIKDLIGSLSSGGSGGGNNSPSSSSKAPATNGVPTGVGSLPLETPKFASKFSDIEEALWADEAVKYLTDKGIINGVSETSFAPNKSLTREQFAVIISRAFELNTAENKTSFEDVAAESYYEEAVSCVFEKGYMIGVSETKFGVGMPVTRQDIATVIFRILGEPEMKNVKKIFSDEADISDYAKKAVEYLSAEGIINGFEDDSFKPKGICTRAQAAKIIYEIIK